jgi:hypothetical protein
MIGTCTTESRVRVALEQTCLLVSIYIDGCESVHLLLTTRKT